MMMMQAQSVYWQEDIAEVVTSVNYNHTFEKG